MIKTELVYNPYLRETTVRFNGRAPRINSMIEKYDKEVLQTWLAELPEIFADEMNGYDFAVEFSGTELDYSDLTKSFADKEISESQVSFFYKNELDGRKKKYNDLLNLLNWVKNNPNRRFDYDLFRKEHDDMFESMFTYIVLHGNFKEITLFDNVAVPIENIDDVNELNGTNIRNTPILLCITEESLGDLQQDVKFLLQKSDINNNQLFFMIQKSLDSKKIIRVIQDLGIDVPQIVSNINDEEIKKYLEIYSVTDYIFDGIVSCRDEFKRIKEKLDAEIEQNIITNQEVYEKIAVLERRIELLKNAFNKFAQRDYLETPDSLFAAKEKLMNSVMSWRNKKTKIVGEEEAQKIAPYYENCINDYVLTFESDVTKAFAEFVYEINAIVTSWYDLAEYNDDYSKSYVPDHPCKLQNIQSFASVLLELKEEQYVIPEGDIVAKFTNLFQSKDDTPKEPVLEITYYYQAWRECAKEKLEPVVDEFLKENIQVLERYFNDLADSYLEHLKELIHENEKEKEDAANQLSEEEKLLQIDNDWLTEVDDQLKLIERG